jgi:hypothetical protein
MSAQSNPSLVLTTKIGFGDESVFVDPMTGNRRYVLGVAMFANAEQDISRTHIRKLKRTGTKMHWHKESRKSRLKICQELATLPFVGLVVSSVSPSLVREERQRRVGLLHVVDKLSMFDCRELHLESRGKHLDAAEVQFIARSMDFRPTPAPIRVGHLTGRQEPLLWLADFVCGAFNLWARGDSQAWKLFEDKILHTRVGGRD